MSDSDRKRKYFSGRSVEQAVVAAANYYGLEPAEVNYREIDKRHGFVRTRRNVVIAVDPESPKLEKVATEPPKAERPSRPERRERPEPAEAAPPEEGQSPRARRSRGDSEEREEPSERKRRERPARSFRREEEPQIASGEGEEEPAEEPREPEGQPRERRERRGGERRPRRSGDRREERAARAERSSSGPWWEAKPVGDSADSEPEDYEEPADLDEDEEEEDEDAPRERGAREDEAPERYRFVERSEGLKLRREPPSPPASGGGEREERERGGGRSRSGRGRGRSRGGRRGGRGGRRDEGGRREAPATPPAPPPPPRSERLPRVEGELAEATQEALDLLLDFIDVEAEADFYRDSERLEIELWGPDDDVLLEDNGEVLLAIEHLLPRMLRGIYGDAMPVRVDCNDFHFHREERLRELARRTADEVRRRGRSRTLGELDPAERRIVHVTLADDADVETESIGDGFYKRLKVLPK